jgi:two-component system phosphate regulon sensor histidine kinase PhoR
VGVIPRNFSSRIFFAFGLLVAVLAATLAWFVAARVAAFQEEEVEIRLASMSSLLVDETRELFEDRLPAATVQDAFATYAAATDVRITVIRADGEVLVDTAVKPPIASHRDRAEFVSAMARGVGVERRSSATTSDPTFYLARRIDGADGPLGAVRLGARLERIAAETAFLRRAFLLGAAIALALGLAGAAYISRRLARPLEAIAAAASEVARGADRTLRLEGPVEVRKLGEAIDRMAAELRSRLVSIERARAETEAILDSLKEGVIAVAEDERLLRMNGAAASLLGLRAPLPPGDRLWLAVRFPELEASLRRVIGGDDESVVVDTASPLDDGTVLALTVTRLADRAGAVAILSDVTAIRRLEKVRSDFVANVSHEMRTPLAVIMGSLETLADPTLGEGDARRFLEIAQLNAERMKLIVEDLLELSKIEAEGGDMSLEPLDLEAPLRGALSALELAASQKGITVVVDDPAERPIQVLGNYKRLEQVFFNLYENAIKYTPQGGSIRVRFHFGEREVGIELEDTGIGIPQHSLARVFERFYRVDKGRSREMGGTGLGLAIVKHAVRAHGGKVTVRSEEGRGTAFCVTLPRIGAPRPLPQPAGVED